MATKWIDGLDYFYEGNGPSQVGEKGFLILFENNYAGKDRYILRYEAANTNVSCEPKLHGWCGTYNDVSTHAEGAWKITRIAKSGRMLITELEGKELEDFLEEMGYPELT